MGLDEIIGGAAGHAHLAGVCGIGMAGLAWLLHDSGWRVSGCDKRLNHLGDALRISGVELMEGHSAQHLDSKPSVVIRSTAVPEGSDEISGARDSGIPVFRRGEVLAALLSRYAAVTVAGTHGKTTTTAFCIQLMQSCGIECGWYLGGELSGLSRVAGLGRSDWLVAEADESDGTLSLYRPRIAVLTNIEYDHMEHFADSAAFEQCFQIFFSGVAECIVWCHEDPVLRRMVPASGCENVSYGFSEQADVVAEQIETGPDGSAFNLIEPGVAPVRVEMPIPGRHNILNFLGAYSAARRAGCSQAALCLAAKRLQLPHRRFEKVASPPGTVVLNDYAHHPTEIAALISMVQRREHGRLRAVFQPHRYTRTAALGENFPAACRGVDELVLCPVYAASEKPEQGEDVWELYRRFRESDKTAAKVLVAGSLAAAQHYFAATFKMNETLLVIGAGDVSELAFSACEWAKRKCICPDNLSSVSRIRNDFELGPATTWGVGGAAECMVEAGCEPDVVLLVKWAHENNILLRWLGKGANLLVSDMGVGGIVARLDKKVFGKIDVSGNELVAGAAVSGRQLLDAAEQAGLAGLEFLEGIPGTLGGMLRMNAGAHGGEVGRLIKWVRLVDSDGVTACIPASEMGFAYRECARLRDAVAIEACFSLEKALPEEIAARRKVFREKRAWYKGLRCAGSVFKNPPEDSAGRLLDAAGCKGWRVGGVVVAQQHANVIVAESGATASDARCLIELLRKKILKDHGINLEPEVVLWES